MQLKLNLVFNELSLSGFNLLPNTEQEAVDMLKKMLAQLIAYRKNHKALNASILSVQKFSSYLFSNTGTSLQDIFKCLPEDIKNILLPAITQKPLLRDIPPYYSYQSVEVLGFAYAHENGQYAISYNSNFWTDDEYQLDQISDDSENLVTVKHLGLTYSSINFYDTLTSSAELWERRAAIFPKFVFCGNTAKQIQSLSIRNKILRQIYEKLEKLHEAIIPLANVAALVYDELGMGISGESDSTLNQYSQQRTFVLPDTDGRQQIFELHIKMPDHRIHFFLDKTTNLCYIGYIGTHLPI